MSEVWLVTSGEYSDYSVVAVCPTEELATAYAARVEGSYGSGTADVARVRLVKELPPPVEVLELRCHVRRDGVTPMPEELEPRWADESSHDRACRVRVDPWWYDVDPRVDVVARGHDHERVRRAHSEATARVVAELDVIMARDDVGRQASYDVRARITKELSHDDEG